jgi:hypothetical protein
MALLDDKAARHLQAKRDLEIASALASTRVLEALNILIKEGITPSIAHGCMMHLRRKIMKDQQHTGGSND